MTFALDIKQRGFTPVIKVTVNGKEVAGGFYSRLIKATIRDEGGQTADQLTIELDDADNVIEQPPPQATIEVAFGWKETGGARPIGTFEMQTVGFKGDVTDGEKVTIQASAADLKKKLKGAGREHFENTTLGAIVEKIAGRNGMTAVVDPDLAKIEVKYRARVDASEIDFLTTLADEHGAVCKPMGSKLVFAKKGAAKAATGASLPAITIEKRDCESWEISPEGRARYGKVRAAWIDQKTGKRRIETAETGLKGPDFTIRDPLPTQEAAKAKAQAEAQRLTRNTGSGSFSMGGRDDAQAEADVVAGKSFRSGIVGKWRAEAVEHTFDSSGWKTKIEVKAAEDGSSSKEKDDEDED